MRRPASYDEFLRFLPAGDPHPAADHSTGTSGRPWQLHDDLVPVFAAIYENSHEHWQEYEACEALVDVEDNFQTLAVPAPEDRGADHRLQDGDRRVERGPVPRKALSLTFFPELYAVRAEIGR